MALRRKQDDMSWHQTHAAHKEILEFLLLHAGGEPA
jgi:hypothetical protein